jgi:hypothetical protein
VQTYVEVEVRGGLEPTLTSGGAEVTLAVPAWRIGVNVEGRVVEYCVDAFFLQAISTVFRRILMVYPSASCKAVPGSRAITVREAGIESAEQVLDMLREACSVARDEAFKPRRSSLLRLVFAPRPEDIRRAEARNAYELCLMVFGREDGFRSVHLVYKARSFIEYPIGVGSSIEWRRLKGLAAIEPRVRQLLENLVENLLGGSHGHRPG